MPSKNTKKRRHQSRNILRAAMATPWAIEPEKLLALREVLELAANGQRFEEAEVQQRIGLDGPPEHRKAWRNINGVAVLPYHGVSAPRMNMFMRISGGVSTQLVAKWFTEALNDPAVKAIILDVDSPGGSAIGNEELSDLIYSARGKKPTKSVVTGMGASAAYYGPSACDEIIASPSSTIGSIGTLAIFTDTTQADADEGIKVTAIHAGKFKADGHIGLDPQTRETLQERVDDYYAQFIAAVARNRGVDIQTIERDYGQGKAFIASKALQRGMIDRIARLEEVVAELSGGSTRPITSPAPPLPDLDQEEAPVNTKIIAALFACDLIASMEPSEEVYKAVLSAHFIGLGQKLPETDEEILSALSAAYGRRGQPDTPPAPAEPTQTVDQIRAAERQRLSEIRSAAELLDISDDDVNAAIESGQDIASIRSDWVAKAAQAGRPVQRETIEPGEAAYDQFLAAATDAILDECDARNSNEPLSAAASDLRNAGIFGIAKQTLQMQGQRVIGNDEEIAARFLQLGGAYSIGSMEASVNRAGDFPNLLSGLAGKILDNAIELAEATYHLWTAKLTDLKDFNPKSIVSVGHFDELGEMGDDEKAPQLTLSEEMPGWIQIGRYGGKFGLTAVMVANDDLDAFGQGLKSMSMAHEYTLNRLCLSLLTSNVQMVDGENLFSTAHFNDVTSGGAISASELAANREKHRQQPGVGGKGKVRTSPKIVLVPTALETAAEQTLNTIFVAESKSPATDGNINTFRGKMRHVVEPELDDASTKKWYTMTDPRALRNIVHAFQKGYGRGGKRTSFYDPDAETRWIKLEGRFASAVGGHRGIVRNAGE